MRNFSKVKSEPLPAKTCYSHLGGKRGFLLMEAFIHNGWIAKEKTIDKHFYITERGEKELSRMGVDLSRI